MNNLEKNENPIIWENNIFKAIFDLSDIELQKLAWSGNHPNFISSYTETLARLYDDLDFERYTEYYRSINGDDRLYKLLNEINLMINDFEDIGYEIEMETDGYKKILENKVWLGITEKAKEIFSEYIILNKEK